MYSGRSPIKFLVSWAPGPGKLLFFMLGIRAPLPNPYRGVTGFNSKL